MKPGRPQGVTANRADTVYPREVEWSSTDPAYFVTMARTCRQVANSCTEALDEARTVAGKRMPLERYGSLSYKRDQHVDLAERCEKRSRRLYRELDQADREARRERSRP